MVRIILIIMLIDSGKRLVKPLKRQEQKKPYIRMGNICVVLFMM